MTNTAIKESLIAQFDKPSYALQLRVLDFAKAIILEGVDGKGKKMGRFYFLDNGDKV